MDLQSFGISETTGFCLEEPLQELGAEFSEWHRLASTMPDLIDQGTVRQEVDRMPQLDTSVLTGQRQQLLAHLQLCNIADGYVYGCGDHDVAKSIPACLAVPLYTLSQELGLPAKSCHANRCLANWALVDPQRPIAFDNIRCLYPVLYSKKDGRFFTDLINMTELSFAPALKSVVAVLAAVDADDADVIPGHLKAIGQCLQDMENTFSRMHELQLYSFLYDIIPYTRGWGGALDNPLPNGLIFQGASETPIKTRDDTAAQSPTIPTMDAMLGVRPSKPDSRDFHLKTRAGMLPGHRRFIDTIEQRPKTLRDFVEASSNTELQAAYNQSLEAVAGFRSKHFQMFAKFMLVASKKKVREAESRGEKEDTPDFSDISTLLKDCRQAVTDKKMPADTETAAQLTKH